ncbi:MAG: hypothetical protein OJF52_003152 [Nitrospira sp.]|nr:MAG: hypothetical protein OJF52_003152 [Nitrospira sp.]
MHIRKRAPALRAGLEQALGLCTKHGCFTRPAINPTTQRLVRK